jgi:hypothetical protein
MYKYEPSAGVLDETYQRLLKLRAEFREESRRLFREVPQTGFGVYDDVEYREQECKYREAVARNDAKLDLVNSLLAPYETEARNWHEFWEARRCAAMMRL